MEEKSKDVPAAPKPSTKRSRRAVLIAPLLFLGGAGGGFLGIQKGIMPLFSDDRTEDDHDYTSALDIAFIPLEPILINLGARESGRFLRFQAQIEVAGPAKAEVSLLIPRLMDVLNGYLRAVDPALLEEPTALVRLKAQMLRRLQMVAGGGRVRDLLVMEFLVS